VAWALADAPTRSESESGFSAEAAACFIHENMKRLYGDRFGKMKPSIRFIGSGYDLVFVGRDRFHQRHELALYGLILDLAVGPQQSQAE
jgi:hypothetical protein